MTKYAPLEEHLSRAKNERIRMTFADIEKIIGGSLPPSARKHRAWWSNNPSNSVMTHAWLAAGYKTSEVNLEGEQLIFMKEIDQSASHSITRSHPLFGCLKGTVTVTANWDLCDPADPDLATWQPGLPDDAD